MKALLLLLLALPCGAQNLFPADETDSDRLRNLEYLLEKVTTLRTETNTSLDALAVSPPTRQTFLSGSGTYTLSTGTVRLVVRLWGAGGGGGGSETANGTNGGVTSFGVFVASGGSGGFGSGVAGAGGTGGSGSATLRIAGASGHNGAAIYVNSNGVAGPANSGIGGEGGKYGAGSRAGGSGGNGEYAEVLISSPNASYSYVVGVGGTGGVASQNGGAGGSGLIIVDEYYGEDVISSAVGASGAAGGDLSGTYPNPSVASLPAISGALLTGLTGANVSGTIPGAAALNVLKSGDRMTGPLKVDGSSVTIIGSASDQYLLAVSSTLDFTKAALVVSTMGNVNVGSITGLDSAKLYVAGVSTGGSYSGTGVLASNVRFNPNQEDYFRNVLTVPSIYGAAEVAAASYPFDKYGELVFQGSTRDSYNSGFAWVTGTGALGGQASPALRMRMTGEGKIVVNGTTPSYWLHVNGNAAFGDAGSQTVVQADGQVTMATNADIVVSGANGYITSQSSITTVGGFFGDGSHLTGIINTDFGPSTGSLRTDLTAETAARVAADFALGASTKATNAILAQVGLDTQTLHTEQVLTSRIDLSTVGAESNTYTSSKTFTSNVLMTSQLINDASVRTPQILARQATPNDGSGVTIAGATGNAVPAGGVTIQGGSGYSSGGTGGTIVIAGGGSTANDRTGGDVNISAGGGNETTGPGGGSVNITAGTGTLAAQGGNVVINGGPSQSGTQGYISFVTSTTERARIAGNGTVVFNSSVTMGYIIGNGGGITGIAGEANTYASSKTFTGGGGVNVTYGVRATTAVFSGALEANSVTLGASIYNATSRTGELSIGNSALNNATSGTSMAIGYQCMQNNVSGNANLAIGYRALASNTTQEDNVALGFYALENSLADRNTAVGYRASEFLSGGASNVSLGSHAGRGSVTTNSPVGDTNSVMIGYLTGRSVVSATVLSNYIGIGYGTLIDRSNQVKIGNTDISETVLYGDLNLPDGNATIISSITASGLKVAYGVDAATASLSGPLTGTGSISLSGAAGVQASSFTATYGVKAATAVFTGQVGIGTTNPGSALDVFNAAGGTKSLTMGSWQAWVPTYGGITSPSTSVARYIVIGKTVCIILRASGTGSLTTQTFTLPFASKNSIDALFMGLAQDNGTLKTTTIGSLLTAGSATVSVYVSPDEGTAWTASGARSFSANGCYEIE